MSDAPIPFKTFIDRCAEILALPPQTIENDRCMFQVGDRWVELRYARDDDRVTFAGLAYIAPEEGRLRADLISMFNAHYLFNGGFSLVQGDEGILYLCRPHQLASMDPRHIREDLTAFAQTVAMAGTWYMRTDGEHSASLSAVLSAGEGGSVLRA